jgi:hypothetical protein
MAIFDTLNKHPWDIDALTHKPLTLFALLCFFLPIQGIELF